MPPLSSHAFLAEMSTQAPSVIAHGTVGLAAGCTVFLGVVLVFFGVVVVLFGCEEDVGGVVVVDGAGGVVVAAGLLDTGVLEFATGALARFVPEPHPASTTTAVAAAPVSTVNFAIHGLRTRTCYPLKVRTASVVTSHQTSHPCLRLNDDGHDHVAVALPARVGK